MNTTNTTNTTKKAFDFNNSKHLHYDLYEYILINLYDDNLTIQKDNKIFVFNWYFEPQRTGTAYQQNTYKRITIDNKIKAILTHLNK
tara:strand:+ start:70 stop:330 length:261 start_codon:yes stop_codon:yes gene_type:complete